MHENLILNTDSYKHSHFCQLPPDTKFMSAYIEARKEPGVDHEQVTLFLGIQPFLIRYLGEPITRYDINQASELLGPHGLPFNKEGWEHILKKHRGYLPLEIQALPEGTLVPRGTPMVQVRNTDPEVPWLTSFIETALLRSIWYPSSVATLSFLTKAIIYEALTKTSEDPEGQIPFKLHDFGARGVSSAESAGLGGLAHLVNFHGTDTLEGLLAARAYYGAQVVGFSIPATEHSTMTAWGKINEKAAYANTLDKFGDGMVSIVSDSYDLWHAVNDIFGDELKEKIENMKGTLVVRPDSGDPIATPLEVIDRLWHAFGGTTNSKGFKVLNPKVRVIQGDGMNAHKIGMLMGAIQAAGYSTDNIAVGMGGGLLQGHMRDDMRFAMKANAIDFGNGWEDVQKKPATDPSKASKAGRQAVYRIGGELVTVREDRLSSDWHNLLETVYLDGDIKRWTSFETVRERAHQELLTFHAKVFAEDEKDAAA